jgi:cobalt-zinc-cadmium efflux system outer membrane protein
MNSVSVAAAVALLCVGSTWAADTPKTTLAGELPDLTASVTPVVAPSPEQLTFRQFMDLTERVNGNLAAQALNVPIAQAQLSAARVRPNPTVTVGIDTKELLNQAPLRTPPTTYFYGLSQTIEVGGKRGARIGVANAQLGLAKASLAGYGLDLRAAAALAYVAVLQDEQAVNVKQQSTAALERVALINSEKRQRGAVSDLVVEQTQVELERAHNDLTAARADYENALAGLLTYIGDAYANSAPPQLIGYLRQPTLRYSLHDAIDTALSMRPDIVAAQNALDVAEKQVTLVQANRWQDVDVAADIKTTSGVGTYVDDNGQSVDPTPKSHTFGITLTVPIPISNLQHGELTAAMLTRDQAKLQLESAKRDARIEVMQALSAYEAARARLARFDAGIRDNARKVLDGTLYSYERGGASLLELLEARRADADTQLEYVEALGDAAAAWIRMEHAVGTWDVDF